VSSARIRPHRSYPHNKRMPGIASANSSIAVIVHGATIILRVRYRNRNEFVGFDVESTVARLGWTWLDSA